MPSLFRRCLQRLFGKPPAAPLDDIGRARALLAAVDRGGLPLNPARVNAIARDLGLEVSRQAAVPETIERIRRAVERADHA